MSPDYSQLIEVQNTDELFRRLSQYHVKPDGSVASAAYMFNNQPPASGNVSVDLARLTTVAEFLARSVRPGAGIGVIIAGDARTIGMDVVHSPDQEHQNYAHCDIYPVRTRQDCKRLAQITAVLTPPSSGRDFATSN